MVKLTDMTQEQRFRDSFAGMADDAVQEFLTKLREHREMLEDHIRWTVDEINDRKAEDYKPVF